MDGPQPIGDDLDRILDEVVTDSVQRQRMHLQKTHADAVFAARDLHRRVWDELVGHEVGLMVMDGMSPRAADQAARNNLAVRRQEIDAELAAELTRLGSELSRKMQRLMEETEHERADQDGETPAS